MLNRLAEFGARGSIFTDMFKVNPSEPSQNIQHIVTLSLFTIGDKVNSRGILVLDGDGRGFFD